MMCTFALIEIKKQLSAPALIQYEKGSVRVVHPQLRVIQHTYMKQARPRCAAALVWLLDAVNHPVNSSDAGHFDTG